MERRYYIDNIFEFRYTTNMHPIRKKPLSREELCRGMPEDAVDKYLSLVSQLYKYVPFLYDSHGTMRLSREERNQKYAEARVILDSIYTLLFKHDAISSDAFCELHKNGASIEFDSIECPDDSSVYVSGTLDDFRLEFEWSLLESDENINTEEEYLDNRYGYWICLRPNPEQYTIYPTFLQGRPLLTVAGHYILRSSSKQEVPYWEAEDLLCRIQADKALNERKQFDLNINFKRKRYAQHYSYAKDKSTSDSELISNWYTEKQALIREYGFLRRLEVEVSGILQTMKKTDEITAPSSPLYIYKGRIVCHQQKHQIVPATGILYNKEGEKIKIDIQYCVNCKRHMLEYTSFEQYRTTYGILIGNLRMISSEKFNGELTLAQESPLRLCGYTVSQAEGLTESERHYILAKMIHDNIMPKTEVIRYLEHFINMNGAKEGNELALSKWENDLKFVHNYRIDTQPEVYITKVEKY